MSKNQVVKSTASAVNTHFEKNKDKILQSLPAGFNYDRACKVVVNAVSSTPAIAECSPASIFMATVNSFTAGLEPNGPTAEAYLVPFFNNKKGVKEAKFMPSYRGIIKLIMNTGKVANISASEVREKDKFVVKQGSSRELIHELPENAFSDRGNVMGYYAIVTYKDGSFDFETMSKADIDVVRESSKSKNSGPWKDWYDEMAKKTVVKRLAKRVEMSIEGGMRANMAINADHQVSTGKFTDAIDIPGIEVPTEEVKKYQEPQAIAPPQTEAPLPEPAKPDYITKTQVKKLWTAATKSGITEESMHKWLLANYSIDSVTKILKSDFEVILKSCDQQASAETNDESKKDDLPFNC